MEFLGAGTDYYYHLLNRKMVEPLRLNEMPRCSDRSYHFCAREIVNHAGKQLLLPSDALTLTEASLARPGGAAGQKQGKIIKEGPSYNKQRIHT